MSPNSQRSLRATEIFGAGISWHTLWLDISPSMSGATGSYFIFENGGSAVDGAEIERAPSGRLIIVVSPNEAVDNS